MTSLYYEGFKLVDICLSEGLDYKAVYRAIRRGNPMNNVIRLPVKTHNGLFSGHKAYSHTCSDCVFMGHTEGHDLYYCEGSHGPVPGIWIIARFGNHVLDYSACRAGFPYKNILIIADRLYNGVKNG